MKRIDDKGVVLLRGHGQGEDRDIGLQVWGQRSVGLTELEEDLLALGIVVDRGRVGSGQDQADELEGTQMVCVEIRAGFGAAFEPNEPFHQRNEAFQPVPARDLGDDRAEKEAEILRLGCGRPTAIGLESPCRLRVGRRHNGPPGLDQRGIGEDADEIVDLEVPVLVAERVDRRMNNGGAPSKSARDIFWRREDGMVIRLEVRIEEVPRGARLRRLMVKTDVTAPDCRDIHPLAEQGARAHGLWVMDHQHVAWLDEILHRRRVLRTDAVVDRAVRRPEIGIAGAVDEVVQGLGQPEEGLVLRFDHQPVGVDIQLTQNG